MRCVARSEPPLFTHLMLGESNVVISHRRRIGSHDRGNRLRRFLVVFDVTFTDATTARTGAGRDVVCRNPSGRRLTWDQQLRA
jgi:hypothetical protein